MHLNPIFICIYANASFASNAAHSWKLSYIIFHVDISTQCYSTHWTSYKSKSLSPSVLESNVSIFADAFDLAYNIKCDLDAMMGEQIELSIVTESLCLFGVLTYSALTTEKKPYDRSRKDKQFLSKNGAKQCWQCEIRIDSRRFFDLTKTKSSSDQFFEHKRDWSHTSPMDKSQWY